MSQQEKDIHLLDGHKHQMRLLLNLKKEQVGGEEMQVIILYMLYGQQIQIQNIQYTLTGWIQQEYIHLQQTLLKN